MKIDHDGLAFARHGLDNTLRHNYDFQRNSSAFSGVTNDWLGGHAIQPFNSLMFGRGTQYLANHVRLLRSCRDVLASDPIQPFHLPADVGATRPRLKRVLLDLRLWLTSLTLRVCSIPNIASAEVCHDRF